MVTIAKVIFLSGGNGAMTEEFLLSPFLYFLIVFFGTGIVPLHQLDFGINMAVFMMTKPCVFWSTSHGRQGYR